MSAPARLAAFAAALVVVFAASYLVAGAVVPERVVDDWTRRAEQTDHEGPAGAHTPAPEPSPSITTIAPTDIAPTDIAPDSTTPTTAAPTTAPPTTGAHGADHGAAGESHARGEGER